MPPSVSIRRELNGGIDPNRHCPIESWYTACIPINMPLKATFNAVQATCREAIIGAAITIKGWISGRDLRTNQLPESVLSKASTGLKLKRQPNVNAG